MKTLKVIKNLIYYGLLTILIILAGLVILSKFNTPLKYRVFNVSSGSMEPTIKTGSLVVVVPQSSYTVGDVITFNIDTRGTTVTHRINSIEVDPDNNVESFVTKGDANDSVDLETVYASKVLGKVEFTIPYVGYAVGFAQTQTGFIVLIVIPATLIVYNELVSIKDEVVKIVARKKSKPEAEEGEPNA